MTEFTLNINGKEKKVTVDKEMPLLWVLRDELNLMGTKYGCGVGECGACTVHINGNPRRSCLSPISDLEGKEIITIEGLSENGDHPVQEAWKSVDVPQCGYCQSGQMMTAAALLQKNNAPDREEIRQQMHGNICRCGTYNSIEKAVEEASRIINSTK